MTVRHDRSTTSVVTTCTDCPYWYAFNWTMTEARKAETRHRYYVHGETGGKMTQAARAAAYRDRVNRS